MRRKLLSLLLTATAALPLSAHEFSGKDLEIGHPYTHPMPGVAPTAIANLTVTNTGTEPDRLVAVEVTNFEGASLHRTEIADGIARMRSQPDGIVIPPGETIAFEPNGYHVMLEGLGGDPIELDETFPAVLIFERAGSVEIVINVDPRGAGISGGDHSDHSDMEGMGDDPNDHEEMDEAD